MDETRARAAVLGWQRTVEAAYRRQAQPAPDEYARIQRFMYDEMVGNSASWTVVAIKVANAIPTPSAKAEAYGMWAAKVRPGGDWDHKRDILDRTAGTNTYTPLPGGNGNIRYDLWSNIHYGYVGVEAGFTPGELRGGADLADLVEHGHTDPGDDVAVRIGIELRERYPPDQLRPEYLDQAIERHRAELTRTGMIGTAVR